jgi:hypothetical protein
MTAETKNRVTVISNDNYLRMGIFSLFDSNLLARHHRGITFIDIDNIGSFNELRKVIFSLNEGHSVVGILRNGVLSRQFHNVATFHISVPLSTIASKLKKEPPYLFLRESWISHLYAILGLTQLSQKQREVFHRLQAFGYEC